MKSLEQQNNFTDSLFLNVYRKLICDMVQSKHFDHNSAMHEYLKLFMFSMDNLKFQSAYCFIFKRQLAFKYKTHELDIRLHSQGSLVRCIILSLDLTQYKHKYVNKAKAKTISSGFFFFTLCSGASIAGHLDKAGGRCCSFRPLILCQALVAMWGGGVY